MLKELQEYLDNHLGTSLFDLSQPPINRSDIVRDIDRSISDIDYDIDYDIDNDIARDTDRDITHNIPRDIKSSKIAPSEIEDFIHNNRKPTLQQVLFSFIDRRDANDVEIYKRAGIDRRHFSKIRSNPNYRIGKNTVIALAFALELNKNDTDLLLSSGGYSLSESDTFDLIVQFCVEKRIYDIDQVNEALDYFSLKPLIG